MEARTAGRLSRTASLGNRIIRYPAAASSNSRSASFSACAAWTAPSSSMPRRHAGQQKSRTKGPTGCWWRYFRPLRRRLRRAAQRIDSADVWWTRRCRVAGTFCRCLERSTDITAVSHFDDTGLRVRNPALPSPNLGEGKTVRGGETAPLPVRWERGWGEGGSGVKVSLRCTLE
jgi:hypothetical protein